MKLILSSSNAFDIEASHMYLRGGCPVVNSLVLQDVQVEVILDEPDRQIFRYRSSILGNGTFSLEIRHDKASDRLWLQYLIEGLAPSQALDSFGLQFQETENLLSYLRNGYTTWDGSTYVDVEAMTDFGHHENRPKTGYAMIQLLPRHGERPLMLGFDRHDRFQHTFTVDTLPCPPALTILTLWDQKIVQAWPAASQNAS